MFRAQDEPYSKPFVFGVGSEVHIPEFVFQPAPFGYGQPPDANLEALLYPGPLSASPRDSTQTTTPPSPSLVRRLKRDPDSAPPVSTGPMAASAEDFEPLAQVRCPLHGFALAK